jgi:energy-coupling factor transporter ATP-binding protein EcfA2
MSKIFNFYDKQIIIKSDGKVSDEASDVLDHPIFEEVLNKFIESLKEKRSELLNIFPERIKEDEYIKTIADLLRKLANNPRDKIINEFPYYEDFFNDSYLLNLFVESLYNYWRDYERFFVVYSENNEEDAFHNKPYRTFNDTIEKVNHFVRKVYRDICENITEDHPRIYRQTSAGCQVGIIATPENIKITSKPYDILKNFYTIKQILIEPPLIIDPFMNKRKGFFREVNFNPLEKLELNKEKWLCYPAKVGHLIIRIYFHNKFIGLGTSLANLFELAREDDLKKKPDAIYLFGVDEGVLEGLDNNPTIFYDDKKNNLLVGAVPRDDDFGYFGYLKKMVLTLHNIVCMKKGMMPIHGAMVKIKLKNGKKANVIIVGDSGAGKSESLEAFRTLAKEYISDMTIIFDDMGSLDLDKKENIIAYGTEIGAFVRLDDLQPGFAFGNIDRSIIMSPQKINARAIIPVTYLNEILKGHKVDYFLYANNYDDVKQSESFFEIYDNPEEAIKIFREGSRKAKGTTYEEGIVNTYFANPFGPMQFKDMHEKIAKKFFKALFKNNTTVGTIKTRLGIKGYETKGPLTAAKALFDLISKE